MIVLKGPDKGRSFDTTAERMVLGRQSGDVPLTDHSISRRHAQLRLVNNEWIIEDIRSSNGTYVNGTRICGPTGVQSGDRIRLGKSVFVFRNDVQQSRNGLAMGKDQVHLESEDPSWDSAILASVAASEQSIILASPETHDAVHAWNVMYQIAEAIATHSSVDELLERMADTIVQHLRVDRLFILMRDDASGGLQPRVVRYQVKRREKGAIVTSRRIINHVLETREGVLCANAQSDARFGADQKDASIHNLGLRSVICVPILTHEEAVGVMHFDCNMARHTYTQQQLLLATAIGNMVGMAIENARLIESRVKNERMAAVGETVAHLSHNIRNILQGMRSGADVIEIAINRGSMENVRTGWQIVQRNVERTYRLAINMLTFSKQRKPHIEMTQLNTLVTDAVSLIERAAADRGVTIETDLGDLPAAPMDADGIHQVASNILTNAIDACPDKSGHIVVSTSYDVDTSDVVLSIRDNGPGISEEDMADVFKPFHSTKGHGGTGLGLAAARQIVDEHDGRLVLKSDKSGTTFTIYLTTTRAALADSDETHGPVE